MALGLEKKLGKFALAYAVAGLTTPYFGKRLVYYLPYFCFFVFFKRRIYPSQIELILLRCLSLR